MPLSSGKIWISGVSGKWRSCRGMRPSAGGSSGRGVVERARQLVLDELDRVAIRRVRVGRVVQRERVERVAVPRRVDLRLEDRQARAAEEAADAREQRLLVGQVDEHLQPGAVARQARLDDRRRAGRRASRGAAHARRSRRRCGAGSRACRARATARCSASSGTAYRRSSRCASRCRAAMLSVDRARRSCRRRAPRARRGTGPRAACPSTRSTPCGLVPRMSATVSR